MTDETYYDLARAVLVAHQRASVSACLCGWGRKPEHLGLSWANHVATVLDEAGALRDRPPVRDDDVTAIANWIGSPESADGSWPPAYVRDAAARLRP